MSLIERVARALIDAEPVMHGHHATHIEAKRAAARAAIAAMREPSEAMCEAAISNRYQTIDAVWSGMIDAALEEED